MNLELSSLFVDIKVEVYIKLAELLNETMNLNLEKILDAIQAADWWGWSFRTRPIPSFFLLFSGVVDRVYFCDAENKSSLNVPSALKMLNHRISYNYATRVWHSARYLNSRMRLMYVELYHAWINTHSFCYDINGSLEHLLTEHKITAS